MTNPQHPACPRCETPLKNHPDVGDAMVCPSESCNTVVRRGADGQLFIDDSIEIVD